MKLWFEGESIIAAIKNQVLMRERMAKAKLLAVFLTGAEWECLKQELNAESDEELGELLGAMEEFDMVTFKRIDAA